MGRFTIEAFRLVMSGLFLGSTFGVLMAVFLRLVDRALLFASGRALLGTVAGALVGLTPGSLSFAKPWDWLLIGAICGGPIGAALLAIYRPYTGSPTAPRVS
jgi:hypothetical protein